MADSWDAIERLAPQVGWVLTDDGEWRGPATQPPNYRPADSPDQTCGNCKMYDRGLCWGYGNKHVDADFVCDSWAADKERPIVSDVHSYPEAVEYRKDYSDDERQKLAKEGKAMPDGSYPIVDTADLKNAIQAIGRAGDKEGAVKAFIKRRASALNASDLVPDDWRAAEEGKPCPTCEGAGKIRGGSTKCPDCKGTGQIAGGPSEQNQNSADDLEERRRHAEELDGLYEHRALSGFELREADDGSVHFQGWAATTEEPYEIADFTETLSKGAFKRTLGEKPSVALNINHGVGGELPLASTKSGTLTLSEDARGLRVDADLDPNRAQVRELQSAVRRGDADEMSFAFRATEQDWNEEYTERTIRAVSLHRGDVSIVTAGANPNTVATIIRSEVNPEYELRIGKSISVTNKGKLKSVLDQIARADEELDAAQPALAEAIGEDNPDADDERTSQESPEVPEEIASVVDIAKARRARMLGGAA